MKYKPDRAKGRVYTNLKNVRVSFDLDLETLFNVTLHPLINDTTVADRLFTIGRPQSGAFLIDEYLQSNSVVINIWVHVYA